MNFLPCRIGKESAMRKFQQAAKSGCALFFNKAELVTLPIGILGGFFPARQAQNPLHIKGAGLTSCRNKIVSQERPASSDRRWGTAIYSPHIGYSGQANIPMGSFVEKEEICAQRARTGGTYEKRGRSVHLLRKNAGSIPHCRRIL